MCEDLGGGGARGRVEGEEGGEEFCAGEGEEGEAGADDGAGGVGVLVLGEAEGAGVGEAFERWPDFFGGDAAEGEDLCVR